MNAHSAGPNHGLLPLCADELVVVLGGEHIGYVVRQIYEALAEQFTEEDIQYQYRFMSCEVLKA